MKSRKTGSAKLELKRESLRVLSPSALSRAAGGFITNAQCDASTKLTLTCTAPGGGGDDDDGHKDHDHDHDH